MEKFKTVEEEQREWRITKMRYRCFYYVVQIFACVLALYLYFKVNKAYGLASGVWLIWNYIQYRIGCQDNVIDEWETGYPTDGVRRMVKSWIFFIPATYLVFKFLLSA